jgi:hypothetical protein
MPATAVADTNSAAIEVRNLDNFASRFLIEWKPVVQAPNLEVRHPQPRPPAGK